MALGLEGSTQLCRVKVFHFPCPGSSWRGMHRGHGELSWRWGSWVLGARFRVTELVEPVLVS